MDGPKNRDLQKKNGNIFVMLFLGRTGSTYIIDVLNQSPAVKFEGEWLERFKESDDSTEKQIQWIKQLFSEKNIRKYEAIGFKTKTFDIPDVSAFKLQMQNLCPTMLVLSRRNVVKHALSIIRIEERAKKLEESLTPGEWERKKRTPAIWNVYDSTETFHRTRVDTKRLHDLVLWLESASASQSALVLELIRLADLDIVTIEYEDLIVDKESFFRKLFSLLGAASPNFVDRVFKHTPNEIGEVVENLDELISYYRGTKYEKFVQP